MHIDGDGGEESNGRPSLSLMASIVTLLNTSGCCARVQQYVLEMVLNLTGDTADRSAAVLDACDEEQLLDAFGSRSANEEPEPFSLSPELAELRALLSLERNPSHCLPSLQAHRQKGISDAEAERLRAAVGEAIERARSLGISLVVAQLEPIVTHLARSLETLAAALRRRGRTFGARLREREQEASARQAANAEQARKGGKQRQQRPKRPADKKSKRSGAGARAAPARSSASKAPAPNKNELVTILRITSRHVCIAPAHVHIRTH